MAEQTIKLEETSGKEELLQQNHALTERISELENILDKIHASRSWKITAPLRWLGRLKRSLTPLFRNRRHSVNVVDLHDLDQDGDDLTITGPTPKLIFDVTSKRPVSSHICLRYNFSCASDHLGFALYYDVGGGFQGRLRKFVTFYNGAAESEVINLGGDSFRFRLDPFDRQGTFTLSDLQVVELGKAQVLARFIKKHWRFLSWNPLRAIGLFKKAFVIFREGGFSALRAKIFANSYSNNYAEWVERYDTLTDLDKAAIIRAIEKLPRRPKFSIIMPTYNTAEEWLVKAIESVKGQLYANWELCIADDCSTTPKVKEIINRYAALDKRIKVLFREKNGGIASASNSAISLATGEYYGFLDHDDELAPHALYVMADAVNRYPDAKLFYSDEDKIDTYGMRFNPYFKSDWNYELLLSQNYICHFTVCNAALVKKVEGFRDGYNGSQDWDLFLRVTERLNRSEIVHLPFILYHWRAIPESVANGSTDAKPYAIRSALRAIADHLKRTDQEGTVETLDHLSQLRVRFAVPKEKPLVSLIILTRDKVKLLRQCISSILSKTSYNNYEIVVVDNGSRENSTFSYFKELEKDSRIRILRIDEPFNFSRLNNLAALNARGSILGFLNNDLEVINKEWLSEMVSHAVRSGVGAVGARLWFPNNLIQHAGVILGIGGTAGHGHKGIERGNPGYFNRAVLTQNFSAVTAACILVPREAFEKVGGFNEVELSVAFNDVDLCLRLNESGYRVVYTPYAELYHYESASRGYENTPKKFFRFEREVEHMTDRWKELLSKDPYYNPNLTLYNEDFSFAFPPRVVKPWRRKTKGIVKDGTEVKELTVGG